MRRRLLEALFSVMLLCVGSAGFAQVNTNPSGGLTVKTLQVEDGGWAFVEFNESNTEISNNCDAADTLFGTFPKVLWLDPEEGGTAQVYATLLALYLTGGKASGLTLYDVGSYCTLYALRVQ